MEVLSEYLAAPLFWSIALMVGLAIAGVLWAPIAALSCIIAARWRGVGGEGYGAAGARCSALMLLPWIYLMARLAFNHTIPAYMVAAAYVLILATWLMYLGVHLFFIVALFIDLFFIRDSDAGGALLLMMWSMILLPISAYNWWDTRRSLWRDMWSRMWSTVERPASIVPDRVYLEPFLWMIVWSALTLFTVTSVSIWGYTDR